MLTLALNSMFLRLFILLINIKLTTHGQVIKYVYKLSDNFMHLSLIEKFENTRLQFCVFKIMNQ